MQCSYRYIALVLLCIFSFEMQAGMLKGKVTDAQGEPLPFATVFIQGTTIGTTTNANAEYNLQLPPGSHKVLCQYMGFRQASFNVTIKGDEVVTHNFSLDEQTFEMKSVTIKANAEDPAYAIIRKAIKRRKFHLEQVESFQTSIYLKGVARSRKMPNSMFGIKINDEDGKSGLDSAGKGVLYLYEQEADYYASGGRERTIIRSVRVSGNPMGFGVSEVPPIVTFYANNACQWEGVSPRGFVSPISDNALHYYSYKYEGEFREGKYTVNKIKVTPKRDHEPLLQGIIYIVEDDWAIHSLDLLATTKSNLELMDSLRFRQTHLPLKKDTWVIKSQVLYGTAKILGMDLSGYWASVYDDQKVNETIPDTIFGSKITTQYDKEANKKDTSYWTGNRPIPLETDESRDYTVKDSLLKMETDPVRLDSIRRRNNRFRPGNLLSGGVGFTSKKNKFTIRTNSLLNLDLVNYNTVEGLNVSPKISISYKVDSGRSIDGKIYTRYGFSNTHFNALGRFFYTHNDRSWKGRNWKIGIEGGKYIYQFNPQSTLMPLYNTFTTLVLGENHMKLYERWNGAISLQQNYGNGFRWSAKVDYQRRLPVNNTTSFSWGGKASETLTPNFPAELAWATWEEHSAAIASASLSYRPGYTYTQYPDFKIANGSRWPLFQISYQKGIPGIAESKSDFDKWRFSIEDDMNLKLFGSLSYNIAAGGFLNDNYVSLPDLIHLSDNELVLASPYLQSFQLAPYYRYSNKANLYGELHLEYFLKGLLTNKIPLLRQAKWYIVMGTNTFYAGQNNYYTEAFAGIDNLGYRWYRFLRVDVVHSWDHLNRQMTGIRLGFNMMGMGNLSLSKIIDEEM